VCVVKRGGGWCVRGAKGFGYDRLRVRLFMHVLVNVCAHVSLHRSAPLCFCISTCVCKRKNKLG
jgi:hypothetical protein